MHSSEMESIGVLMLYPMFPYLEQELDKRFKLYRFWNFPQKTQFLKEHANSIHAVVGNSQCGPDAEMIEALPKLEIVSTFSVGVDAIDVAKCKQKGIPVTNTPDVLTDEVADLAIGLILALLRRLCECDRYVRSGNWKKGDYKLTTKVIVDHHCFYAIHGKFYEKKSMLSGCVWFTVDTSLHPRPTTAFMLFGCV